MVDLPDASGPPYPYPIPLPAEAKQSHLRAIGACKRRLNRWVLLAFIPGFTLALVPVLSGLISEPSLWVTDPAVARTLLIAGSVLCLVGLVPAVLISRRMRRHIRLLRSYGVPINSAGIEHGPAKGRLPILPTSPGALRDGVDLDDNAALRDLTDDA